VGLLDLLRWRLSVGSESKSFTTRHDTTRHATHTTTHEPSQS
jgi:hypothetical protein